MKKILSLLLAALLVFGSFGSVFAGAVQEPAGHEKRPLDKGAAGYHDTVKAPSIAWTVPAGYNSHDYNACAAFLETVDLDGNKIGEKLYEEYDPSSPSTWTGVDWITVNGEKRIKNIWFISDSNVIEVETGLDLSGCIMLENLTCQNVNLSALNLSGDTALMRITCSLNHLSLLDVSTCTSLEELDCTGNNLISLNVSNCRELRELYCGAWIDYDDNDYYNEISVLDLTYNSKLEALFCDNNQLSELDISNCPNLSSLDCENNQLSSLDVTHNPELSVLSCGGNAFTVLDLSNATILSDLRIEWGKEILSLDLSHNTNLHDVYICGTQIESLDLSEVSDLRYCEVYTNLLLKSIYLPDVVLYADGIGYLNTQIDYEGNRLAGASRLSGALFYGWYDENGTLIAEAEDESAECIQYIDLSNNNEPTLIAHFTPTFNTHDTNKLRSFLEREDTEGIKTGDKLNWATWATPYNANDPLTWGCDSGFGDEWYGYSNIFKWKDVEGELRISEIHLGYDSYTRYTDLGPLDVSDCTSLEWICACYNGLTELKVTNCSSLHLISCDGNGLNGLDLSGCASIEYVCSFDNELESVTLDSASALNPKSIAVQGNGTIGCEISADYCIMAANPDDGATFLGWYNVANELISGEEFAQFDNFEENTVIAKFSEDNQTVYSGTCGDNLTWTLNINTGALKISGNGAMTDWSSSNNAPWYDYRSEITSVEINDGVTSIGDSSFYDCTELASVIIPDSVTTIGKWAFNNCSSLTSVTIPNSTMSILYGAFMNCSTLASVTISDGVESICDSVFFNCTSLTSVTIGNDVAIIGNSAFSGCTSLTSATIPDSVTSIGIGAFWGCISLSSIIIPDSVTTINDGTFYNCDSLTSATIPDSVMSIGGAAFRACRSLTSVTIGNSVASIGDYAFEYCCSLTTLTIPDSVTSIGNYAFENCHSLPSAVFLGVPLSSFGDGVFNRCAIGCSSDFCIYYTSDYASEWAPNGETEWNGYPIRMIGAPELDPGDLDGDGQVSMADVTMISMHLNGENPTMPAGGMDAADANGDGMVDIRDIAAIYAIIANS